MITDQGGDKRVFHALDGMRGVAAIFVAMRHTYFFHRLGIGGGYMAVDLFFVLSGFVIAHAYERRFEMGLSPARFLLLRYLRLWPVYAVGALLGLAAAWANALPPHDALTAQEVVRTAPYALVMAPGPQIKPMLYPVNSVAWSLLLELIANGAYALFWRPMRKPVVLASTLVVSALALVGAVCAFGKLDIGFQWVDMVGGLPRVAFSFTAGLAVYQLHRAVPLKLKAPAWVWVAVLPPLFCFSLGPILYPLTCVFVLFPALVVLAAAAPQPGAGLSRLFAGLGAASYPLYAMHKPLGEMVVLATHRVTPSLLRNWPVQTGVVYLTLLIGLCIVIERRFDRPVRRSLNREVFRLMAAARDMIGAGLDPLNTRLNGRRP